MGIEIASPDVEESTEPPICGSNEDLPSLSRPQPATSRVDSLQESKTTPATTLSQSTTTSTAVSADVYDEQDTHVYAHTLPAHQVALHLRVDVNHGLSSAEAASRLERDGPNKVKSAEGVSAWEILLRQVSNSLTMVCSALWLKQAMEACV